jgi:flagellar M-ring protein FliF
MDNLDPNSAEDGVTEAGPLSFMNNPDVQRILPYIVGSLVLAICVLFYLWVSAPTYRSVYPGMSESDRQQAKDALDGAGFAPRIDVNTGALQVADERYHEARILLASQDIPRSATAGGFENLLEQGSMTTSRFMEQVSYRAAMETELAKSIKEIATIRGARVHLAEPQQSVFVRNQTPAKASCGGRSSSGTRRDSVANSRHRSSGVIECALLAFRKCICCGQYRGVVDRYRG